jgi:hypothetical protein
LSEASSGIAEDGGDTGGIAVDENEGITVDLVVAFPTDGEAAVGFVEVEFLRIAVPCDAAAR